MPTSRDKFRPGHADFTYQAKYGMRDYRGGGRSSARETACRVAAGAVARKVIGPASPSAAPLSRSARTASTARRWDWGEIDRNPFFSPDAAIVDQWSSHLDEMRKAGSSTGAVVEVLASGVPPGWGAPVYGKLDQPILPRR